MRQELLRAGKILHNDEDGNKASEKPVQIPLSTKEFLKTIAVSTAATGVTPQMALLETMAAMHKKAQEITGIPVPKYYNPAAVNPLKYAEQVQKRKLLWSKAKDHKEDKEKEWQGSTFTSDQDGKVSAKFRKLMGMKDSDGKEEHGEIPVEMTEEQKRKQAELFSRLDKEYEFARMTTHTQRGVGLGFSSHPIYPAGSGGGGAT